VSSLVKSRTEAVARCVLELAAQGFVEIAATDVAEQVCDWSEFQIRHQPSDCCEPGDADALTKEPAHWKYLCL
jgi:hypothetical protein